MKKKLERETEQRQAIEMLCVDMLVPEDHLLRKIDAAVDLTRIYDLTEDLYCEDKGRPSCKGHCEGGFDAALEVLADCDALFVAKIGEAAALAMLQRGKRVFEATGPVDEIIEEILGQGLLDDLTQEKSR